MLTKRGVAIIASVGLLFLSYGALELNRNSIYYSMTKAYVERNIERIMAEQEQKLGISCTGEPLLHFAKSAITLTTFVLNEERTKPVLDKKGRPVKAKMILEANYIPADDSLMFYTSEVSTPGLLDRIVRAVTFSGKTRPVDKAVNHELAHRYTDGVCRSLDKKGWARANQSVSEGIALSVEVLMTGDEAGSLNEIPPSSIAGYNAVKEIVSRYGRRGIDYIIQNAVPGEDLMQFKERALNELAGMSGR